MKEYVLGISAFYHDSAAALLKSGEIISAAHEERFTRKKHDSSFPENAIKYALGEAGISFDELSCIVFYDKPFLKFERLMETYHSYAPRGLKSFIMAMPVWIKEKLLMKKILWRELDQIHGKKIDRKLKLLFSEHHLSHAASAYYPSPYDHAAILTIDGVGEWATTTIGIGDGSKITVLKELPFPHSIGLLYSAFTYYCGFKVNSGEYKLMGLAPYGISGSEQVESYKSKILSDLIDLRDDGSLLLNMDYFDFAIGLTMTKDSKWDKLFNLKRRKVETDDLTLEYMNLALAIQEITTEIVIRLAKTAKEVTKSKNLVMAGGVALNCVANGIILREKIFENIWIQPAAGDAGGALGAAYVGFHIFMEKEMEAKDNIADKMKGSYLGPQFFDQDIVKMSKEFKAPNVHFDNFDKLCSEVANIISKGDVVGWFQGRMEWGPRALGARTILGDPRNAEMQKKLNMKIKYREGFRPFAPSVLEEDISNYFDMDCRSPYMLLVAPVKKERRNGNLENAEQLNLYERLYAIKSDIPAVTHIDYSARIQSVSRETNERYWKLINKFKEKTGFSLLVNTSFNVRGEPIVCTPEDAYICFMRTEMDYLVMGDRVFNKADQPKLNNDCDWKKEFVLD